MNIWTFYGGIITYGAISVALLLWNLWVGFAWLGITTGLFVIAVRRDNNDRRRRGEIQ